MPFVKRWCERSQSTNDALGGFERVERDRRALCAAGREWEAWPGLHRLRLRILEGTQMNGLHLIGDLSGCRCNPQLLLDGAGMRERCVQLVAEAGLTTMDAHFHQFDGGGYTGMVLLAESHLALHTWPERQGITLDVYVC